MGVVASGMRALIGHREPGSPAQFVPTWMSGEETLKQELCSRSSHGDLDEEFTHRWAIPALRTAQEIAFTAVHREFSSVVNSPVPFAFRPCSMTKRVTVTTLVSKAPRSDMVADVLP